MVGREVAALGGEHALGHRVSDRVRDDHPARPRGKAFDAALADAETAGHVTPELTAAFHDPVVAAARWYEVAVVTFIIVLMVTKPF